MFATCKWSRISVGQPYVAGEQMFLPENFPNLNVSKIMLNCQAKLLLQVLCKAIDCIRKFR